jgi:hypothetical protein
VSVRTIGLVYSCAWCELKHLQMLSGSGGHTLLCAVLRHTPCSQRGDRTTDGTGEDTRTRVWGKGILLSVRYNRLASHSQKWIRAHGGQLSRTAERQ